MHRNYWKVSVLLLMLGLFNAGCGGDGQADIVPGNGLDAKATHVQIMPVQPDTFVEYITVTGTVRAMVDATVSAEVNGVIEAYVRDQGERVSRGDMVVKLKSKELQASVDEARAAYRLSEATFKRQANLFKDNVISEQKYLEFKFKLEMDRARFESLQARLEKTEIRSPFTGIIDQKLAEVGEFVVPGAPLFRVVQTEVVNVRGGVPERYVGDVGLGTSAEVTFDILPGQTFDGEITFVGPSIDAQTRTFPIEIALNNPGGLLKPEMFANVKIRRRSYSEAMVVPRDAVLETESGKYVFVAEGPVAMKRDVTLSAKSGNEVLITRGLEFGDHLIVVGHRDLSDGERIEIQP